MHNYEKSHRHSAKMTEALIDLTIVLLHDEDETFTFFTPRMSDKGIRFYLEFNPPSYEYGVSKMVYFLESACCLFDDGQVFLWK